MAETKWHINDKGVAGRCKADDGNCPISPGQPHFETASDARAAYEEEHQEETVSTISKPKKMNKAEKSRRTRKDGSANSGGTVSHGLGHGGSGRMGFAPVGAYGSRHGGGHGR